MLKDIRKHIASVVMLALLMASFPVKSQAASKCSIKNICICTGVTALALAGAGVGGYYLYKALSDEDKCSSMPSQLKPLTKGNFTITLVNTGPNNLYDDAFQKAKDRWESIIINDLPDLPENYASDWFAGYLPESNSDAVDDVIIGYSIEPIDGQGGILGQAGPTFIRSGYTSAVAGIMLFDEEDFARMSPRDRELVVLHEMGHVFGIGTFWRKKCGTSCSTNHQYTCPKAINEYNKLGFANTALTLENDGGPGTQCGHWDEDSFQSDEYSELMTGLFESHKRQPLSAVTAAALEDLGGYVVNYEATDSFDNVECPEQSQIPMPSTTFDLHDLMVDTVPVELLN